LVQVQLIELFICRTLHEVLFKINFDFVLLILLIYFHLNYHPKHKNKNHYHYQLWRHLLKNKVFLIRIAGGAKFLVCQSVTYLCYQ